jgi:CheY-like chemotaxis protein
MTLRVLVVDDELDLDDASGEKIILLVSDITMPGMSGLDLLPIVRTRRLAVEARRAGPCRQERLHIRLGLG